MLCAFGFVYFDQLL